MTITVSNVGYAYGARSALRDVSFIVGDQEFVGLVGPNSAGKSTLLRLLCGALSPLTGRVELEGRALEEWSLRERARAIAVVSAESYFAFPFTVRQIVLMGRTPHRPQAWRDRPEDEHIAAEAMKATETWELRDRPIHELSSGERQRALLARALAQEPRVLLLDEPSTHLDIGHEWALFELLRRLHSAKNLTVLCTLHNLPLAARYCDRLVLIADGRLLASGPPPQVLTPENLRDAFRIAADVQWSSTSGHSSLLLTPASPLQRNPL